LAGHCGLDSGDQIDEQLRADDQNHLGSGSSANTALHDQGSVVADRPAHDQRAVGSTATPNAPQAAATGSTYNSTTQGANSQGDPDWVLVLQAPFVVRPATGLLLTGII
jgi:hypothetical protein